MRIWPLARLERKPLHSAAIAFHAAAKAEMHRHCPFNMWANRVTTCRSEQYYEWLRRLIRQYVPEPESTNRGRRDTSKPVVTPGVSLPQL